MSQKRWRPLCLLPLIAAAPCLAGPPYVTDDPEPVELHHWEFYFATEQSKVANTFSATAPHLEINFGAAPNLQVHTIIPINYVNSGSGPQYGFGDLELGAKFRFIEEGQWLPQFGIFPLFEVPTGDAARGLGNGAAQALLPLWLQKSFG
ncbi:MAG: hypothetical protein ACXVCH_07545, partial [Bdellovibrionota bacterium]